MFCICEYLYWGVGEARFSHLQMRSPVPEKVNSYGKSHNSKFSIGK